MSLSLSSMVITPTVAVAKKGKAAKAPSSASKVPVKLSAAKSKASAPKVAAAVAGDGQRARRITRTSGVSDNAIITMYNRYAKISSADRKSFIPEAQRQIQEIADDLLSGALSVTTYRGASTITAEDLNCAMKARGHPLYGAGNDLSLVSQRRQQSAQAARKKKHREEKEGASTHSLAGEPAAAVAATL